MDGAGENRDLEKDKIVNPKIKRTSKNLPLTLLLWRRTKDEAIKKGF